MTGVALHRSCLLAGPAERRVPIRRGGPSARFSLPAGLAMLAAASPAFGGQQAGPQLAQVQTSSQARIGPEPTSTEGSRPTQATEVTIGATAWSGDFGAPTRSDIAVALLNVRQRAGDLRFDATLPWMRIRSSATIFTGIDGTPLVVAPNIPMGRQKRQGFGDLTVGASWRALKEERAGLSIGVSARAKLPTASDASQLSTGKADYAFGIEASKRVGAITPLVQARYRIFGDPAGWRIRDGFATSVGASAAVNRDTVLLVSYDFAERTSRFIQPSHELVAAVTSAVDRRFRLTAFGSAGLSSGAAAFSSGASLTISF